MQHLKIVLISILTLNLTNCVSGAIAGTTAAASTILYDERSVETMLKDQNIEHLSAEAISRSPKLAKTNIYTSSLNQNVLLYGETTTPEQRTIAQRITQNIPNVKKVYNQITINNTLSALDSGKDSFITGKVRMALFRTKQLHSAQVRVITENRTVYLMGILSKYQQRLAIDTTKKVSGVKKVVTLFELAK